MYPCARAVSIMVGVRVRRTYKILTRGRTQILPCSMGHESCTGSFSGFLPGK